MTNDLFSIFKTVYSAQVPIEIKEKRYTGKLRGIYNDATGIFNVLPLDLDLQDKRIEEIGEICEGVWDFEASNSQLLGVWEENELKLYYKGKTIEYKFYSIESDIKSRNKGIVDNVHLKDSYAVIVGCGYGSFIALELTKCGVGNFILVDNDTFAYHNISRHQCGILDVGKRKVDLIEERIKQINPLANTIKYFSIIQDVFVDELMDTLKGKNGIIINCGDNRLSSYYSNKLAIDLNLFFMSVGASYLAAYGELFWYVPNADMPCYACLHGNNFNKTNNNEEIRHWYAGEEELAREDFIPALSVDIDYINVIATKYAVELLMLSFPGYKPRYIQYSTPFMFVSNFLYDKNNNSAMGITEPLQVVKTSLAVRDDCIICQKNKG